MQLAFIISITLLTKSKLQLDTKKKKLESQFHFGHPE